MKAKIRKFSYSFLTSHRAVSSKTPSSGQGGPERGMYNSQLKTGKNLRKTKLKRSFVVQILTLHFFKHFFKRIILTTEMDNYALVIDIFSDEENQRYSTPNKNPPREHGRYAKPQRLCCRNLEGQRG